VYVYSQFFYFFVPFIQLLGVAVQLMSERRQSLQRVLRIRRRASTTVKQSQMRSVRRKVAQKRDVSNPPSVAIDSFVEDSLSSQHTVKKRRRKRTRVDSVDASAGCVAVPSTVCGADYDAIDDKYNMLESTEELELPCQERATTDEMMVCGPLDGDVTIVSDAVHLASDVDNADVTAGECHTGADMPQPLPLPVVPHEQATSDEHPATNGTVRHLSSHPAEHNDTPATATRHQSSVANKVATQQLLSCINYRLQNIVFVSVFYVVLSTDKCSSPANVSQCMPS